MSAIDCFKDYFKRAFDFKGVSSRKEYWLMWAFFIVISFFGFFLMVPGVMLYDSAAVLGVILLILGGLVWAALLFPYIALMFRRLHDAGMSAWFILLSFVPLGNIVVLVMLFLDTVTINNKWRERDIQRGYWVKYLDED